MFKSLYININRKNMKLLELVMIVKNSGNILRQCLQENRKWIDHWTILDTGSTDNTPNIIKEELKDIPGNLYFGEFIDFSQARNKSLELSSKKCKYTIILDDSYKLYGGKELRNLLKKAKTSCFLIKIGKYMDGFVRDDYFSKRIVKSEDNLRYKYRVHEDIMVSENKLKFIQDSSIFIDDITFKEHTKRSFNRYLNDIELLKLDHKDEPYEQRIIYYLAKTYYVIDDFKTSLEYFEKLRNLKNVREDFLFASYYESACIHYHENDNIEEFRERLFTISQMFPDRVEPQYKLAVLYRDSGDVEKVNEIVSKIVFYPKPIHHATLLENDIYDYYIPYLYIDSNLALGHIDKAIPALKKMLTLYPNDQPLLNIKYNVCASLTQSSIELSNKKTIVFHTGCSDIIYCWNPALGDSRISGSEYMAMNLGKEFLKLGYRVFVIGTFEDDLKTINYEGVYEGIEYIDYKYFSEFALKYVIDYLIVSRYTSNLIYYDNVKNVYLWIHDVLPLISDNSRFIQYHRDKFKYIIGISEWQKQNTVKKLNIPEEKIIVSRNAIYIDRFLNKNVKKVPYRFIYSSCAERGLNILIDIIPKIKEQYPETTLHLFVLKERIDNITLKKIDSLDYVFLNSRVSQEELAIEFLKSDIWLYPTTFPETYCITSLEAMAAKCLICTVDYCGLGNIVKGRGITCKPPIKDNTDDLLKKLFFTLERPQLKNHYIDKAYEWAMQQTYDKLAIEWENIFNL